LLIIRAFVERERHKVKFLKTWRYLRKKIAIILLFKLAANFVPNLPTEVLTLKFDNARKYHNI